MIQSLDLDFLLEICIVAILPWIWYSRNAFITNDPLIMRVNMASSFFASTLASCLYLGYYDVTLRTFEDLAPFTYSTITLVIFLILYLLFYFVSADEINSETLRNLKTKLESLDNANVNGVNSKKSITEDQLKGYNLLLAGRTISFVLVFCILSLKLAHSSILDGYVSLKGTVIDCSGKYISSAEIGIYTTDTVNIALYLKSNKSGNFETLVPKDLLNELKWIKVTAPKYDTLKKAFYPQIANKTDLIEVLKK